MRFKDFLFEGDETAPPLKDLIDKNCPGLIKRLGGQSLLYRGVSSLGELEGKFSVQGGDVLGVK